MPSLRRSEVRGQRSEVGAQRSEVGGQSPHLVRVLIHSTSKVSFGLKRWGRKKDVPIAPAMLEVVITRTFRLVLSLSSWVRSALTTCARSAYCPVIVAVHRIVRRVVQPASHRPTLSASLGSVPFAAPLLAAVSDSTSSGFVSTRYRNVVCG